MTERKIWENAYRNAQRELSQAHQNFQYAQLDYIDIAIYDLIAKEKKLERIYRKLQELELGVGA